MTMARYLLLRFHMLFGMHAFKLVKVPGRDAFRARCRCGAYLR